MPILQKPHSLNPANGFLATSNQNVTPDNYPHWDAIGFSWSDPFRGIRINEVLSSGKKLTMNNMKALQVDYLSIPARILTPLLANLPLEGRPAEARNILRGWDFKLKQGSIEAAIYVAWEKQLKLLAEKRFIPEAGKGLISIQTRKLVDWITMPDSRFGVNPITGRDRFLREAFIKDIKDLEETLGADIKKWQYGQEKFKHVYMTHALGKVVKEDIKTKLNLGPLPRGGNGDTPGSTGVNNLQNTGATFRMIVNTGDWDSAVATNGPGQSGDPESPFYSNLFVPWAKDQYFPVYYSKEKILGASVEKVILKPLK